MEYKQFHKQEMHTEFGSLGIQIMVATNREFNDADQLLAYKAADLLIEGLWRETLAQDPKQTEAKLEEAAEIFKCFGSRMILAEPIPNEYCSRWCCSQKPWYIITTSKGRVKIGWRKHVINISWDASVADTADILFPNANVTKFDYTIHAWGYEKAKEYISKILGEP